MKLFYFGSACSGEIFDRTVSRSRVKPSASAQSFETALLKGLGAIEDIEICAVSAESVAMYPGGDRLILKRRRDMITDNIYTNIIPALNIPFFKQLGHANGVASLLKKWLSENRDISEKCVLSYGLYPSVTKKLQTICKKCGCKCYAVVTDAPATMFTYTNSKNLLKKLFGKKYRDNAINLQKCFDGYIYLTKQMSEAIAPNKPFDVVETIADTKIFDLFGDVEKNNPPAIMYAGSLYKKFGIDLIVDTFKAVKSDAELWLFGSGDYEETIKKEAENDKRIKFFGRVDRETVLKAEKSASLLINLRNSNDEYTKYSFPSKMIEYMLSGTPLLTTKLDGIPGEYYSYVYSTEENDPKKIAGYIDKILDDIDDMNQLGEKARNFVMNNKNCYVQAKKIYEFLTRNV